MPKYHMQRKDREIADQNELIELLKNGKYAIISMCRQNEPYIATLNYGYDQVKNALYFHCAKNGLKLDFIKQNPIVCATVIDDRGYIMDECEHRYRSVVFWGEMSILQDLEEKKYGIDVLINHLEKNPEKVRQKSLKSEEDYQKVGILRLDIKEISGKKRL